jgi:hypothetical protein
VPRGKSVLLVVAFAAFCLAFGYWWSVRVGLPLNGEKPWWYGKDAHVRIQVLEEGHDMATVSMRLPKGFMDTIVALGTNAKISFDDNGNTNIGYSSHMQHEIRLRDIWKDLQKLPKGQKITIDENGAKLSIWIEA